MEDDPVDLSIVIKQEDPFWEIGRIKLESELMLDEYNDGEAYFTETVPEISEPTSSVPKNEPFLDRSITIPFERIDVKSENGFEHEENASSDKGNATFGLRDVEIKVEDEVVSYKTTDDNTCSQSKRNQSLEMPYLITNVTQNLNDENLTQVPMPTSSTKPTSINEKTYPSESHLATSEKMKDLIKHCDNKPYSCVQSPAEGKVEGRLTSHSVIHSIEKPFACDQCSVRFKHKKELERHLVTDVDGKLLSCQHCLHGFKVKAHLKRHLATHSGDEPLTCNECFARFENKQKLKQHLVDHFDGKLFAHKQHSAQFETEFQLERQHSDEKSFSCKQCFLGFKSEDALKKHLVAKHLSGKRNSYSCCSVSFERKDEIAEDMKAASDEALLCERYPARLEDTDTAFSTGTALNTVQQILPENSGASFLEESPVIWLERNRVKLEDRSLGECNPAFDGEYDQPVLTEAETTVMNEATSETKDKIGSRSRRNKLSEVSSLNANISQHSNSENLTQGPQIQRLVSAASAKLLPTLNPDGYVVTSMIEKPFACATRNETTVNNRCTAAHCGENLLSCERQPVMLTQTTDGNGCTTVCCDENLLSCESQPVTLNPMTGSNDCTTVRCDKNLSSCELGPEGHKLNSEFKEHFLSLSDDVNFICKQCSTAFDCEEGLKSHLLSHSDKKPFACEHCPLRFRKKSYLRDHLATHLNEKSFICKQCPARFNHKRQLKAHLVLHCDEKPFVCKLCPSRFKRKINLQEHLAIHSDEKPFICKECLAPFKTQHGLRKHLPIHSGERPFACDQCLGRFLTRSHLKRHLVTHLDEKSFACTQCSARFKAFNNLKRHLIIHSDERPFSCNRCPAQFKSKRVLCRHFATHSHEKPFVCEQCPMRFKSNDNLKKHFKKKHVNEEVFSCPVCSVILKTNDEVTGHMKMHFDNGYFFHEPGRFEDADAAFSTGIAVNTNQLISPEKNPANLLERSPVIWLEETNAKLEDGCLGQGSTTSGKEYDVLDLTSV